MSRPHSPKIDGTGITLGGDASPKRSVTVRVPATSANLGPGYDCLGMAVSKWVGAI